MSNKSSSNRVWFAINEVDPNRITVLGVKGKPTVIYGIKVKDTPFGEMQRDAEDQDKYIFRARFGNCIVSSPIENWW